ncbi:PVC-type heme-binding CxxCH protein [Rosistilla oblonga]|uniref:PVC-type heme-binding CxxCH protein n=1 Tax=Rosistilla oblonga TaxID=2527990 RepID=UPI003A96A9E6
MPRSRTQNSAAVLFVLFACIVTAAGNRPAAAAEPLRLLFMGDNGHHRPAARFLELATALQPRGISLQYTDRMDDLNPDTLAGYDGLVLYANIDKIEDDQAAAVLDFVASGNGFIPLHCATYCWRNHPEMIALMGAQFQRHGGRVFSTEIAAPQHPVMQGFGGFTSWDETYIHHLHNEKDRTVLEYRAEGEQADGKQREPWTWVRTHGKGRVFYTAWGHDQRTFDQPGFHNLVERGIRWACGDDPGEVPAFVSADRFSVPAMTTMPRDRKPFEFVDVGPKIPDYTPSEKWGVQAENQTLMQQPLSPEESIKHFVTPEGMEVRRYADERDFQAKPIAMAWDERGRLWVCETVDYPNELGRKRDRIRICEDTDGDQVADKFILFAEGLSVPTAIAIVRGGAVVQDGAETVYLKDTDEDDVADQRTVLISDWNLRDTHGGVSNFRYGLDNWIWAMQGYNNSAPKVGDESAQAFRMGFWRFKLSQTDPPRVTDLEFVRSTDNNTWGLGISEEGLIFGSTANRNPSVFMPIANRYYESVRGWAPPGLGSIADTHRFAPITKNVRQVDHHGGYTAGAGHALYTARAFPQPWWNKTAFVCGPTGHLVGTFVLRRDGAGYTSTSPCNLLASDDQWSAPIMAEVGPDGAVWVIDWYNYIVQHNPTPKGFTTGKGAAYESDLRDKKHGRIYRVVPTDGQTDRTHAFTSLADATDVQLVETLRHPSFPWRLQAQRLLIERQSEGVLQPLLALLADSSVDSIGLNVAAIHALHTLQGLGYIRLDERLLASGSVRRGLQEALGHPSPGVRRNALAVLPHDSHGLELVMASRSLLEDADLQVRLQAILTLADMPPSSQAGELVAELAQATTDRLLLEALTSAAAKHNNGYLTAVLASTTQVAPANLQIAARVAEHVARGRPDAEQLQSLLAGVAGSSHPALVDAVLDGLIRGVPRDFALKSSPALDAALVAAFEKSPASAKNKLIRLALQCRTNALDSHLAATVLSLTNLVANMQATDAARVAAAKELVGFRSDDVEVVEEILDQITPQTPPGLATSFLQAVQGSKSDVAGEAIVDAVAALTPGLKSDAISALLSRPAWARSLLDGIESRAVELSDLSLEQKQSLGAFPDPELKARAGKLLAMGGGLPDADRQAVLDSLHHVTLQKGDVDAGLAVFKKHCAACHVHGEIGKTLGPNLTGMAVHPKEELLTHIIDPSRSVEGNFRMYTVLTADGRVVNGMLAGESRTSLTLIDSTAKEINIQREDIDELVASRKSVMPEGFEKQIGEVEFTDLLEFLTNKGKFVPVPLDRYATAISTRPLFSKTSDKNSPDRMIFADWQPKMFADVPFVLVDPQGATRPNIILLNGPHGTLPPSMPLSVSIACNTAAKKIHLLGGVGGYSFPYDRQQTVSMIVRLKYADGLVEEHPLVNGIHIADYIRRVDVPKSEFAFALRGQQIRYLAIVPKRDDTIETIELRKGPDGSAPIVMAVTVER